MQDPVGPPCTCKLVLPFKLLKFLSSFRIRFLALADEHVNASKDYVVDSDYSGSHWLASFLFYSLDRREDALEAMNR